MTRRLRLIARSKDVRRVFGAHPVRQFLFTTIRRDSHRVVRPVGMVGEGVSLLFVRQQEHGNAHTAGVTEDRLCLYEPYVTFDPRLKGIPAAVSFASAVAERTEGGVVEIGADLPEQHLRALHDEGIRVDLRLPVPDPVDVVRIRVEDVLRSFRGWRRVGVEAVRPVLTAIDQLAPLADELTWEAESRFEDLERRLTAVSAGAVLVSSAPNATELTGSPYAGGWVLWSRGADEVHVITPRRDAPVGTVSARFPDLGAAVAALAGSSTRIAVEDEWLRADEADLLRRAGLGTVAFSRELGTWRDLRDREDLPFQLIAARASAQAIEGAIAWAHEQLDAGRAITELDVHRRHLGLVQDFRRAHGLPFTISPYMVNAHSSHRVIQPCLPAEYVLDPDDECMMLDAGVRVGFGGVVLGTSDMARSLVRGERYSDVYALVREVVTGEVIPRIRADATMESIHDTAMDAVGSRRAEFERLRMLDPGIDFLEAYRRRNVGHLMGKQESFSNEFRPGDRHALRTGDLGAAELPWIFGDVAVTYEDMWYIDGSGTVHVTTV